MAIYSESVNFPTQHSQWWFSIVLLVYQRIPQNNPQIGITTYNSNHPTEQIQKKIELEQPCN